MRLLVCGGRDFQGREFLFACLDKAHAKRPITAIIQGASRGADSLAHEWALFRNLPSECYVEMLEKRHPDSVVTFPGGRGTAHMVSIAKAKGLPVWEPKP